MKGNLEKEARVLRKRGDSIKSISKKLGVSQSTASRWCNSIQLSQKQQALLEVRSRAAGLKALKPWIEQNRKIKINDIKQQLLFAKRDIGDISKRDLFCVGLGLYWGEGYKRGSQECGFTNSDPALIRFIMRWFNECYNITHDRFIARLTINDLYRSEYKDLLQYWSKEIGIPEEQFSLPAFITGYGRIAKDRDTYRGTLRLKVRNGTSLRRRILAAITLLS